MKNLRYICVVAAATFIFTACSSNFKSVDQSAETSILSHDKEESNKNNNAQVSTADKGQIDIKPESKTPSPPEIKNTDAAPNGKIIVIDPGHANRSNLEKEANAPGSNVMKIKDGGGAAGIVTRTPEYAVNMEVALRLKKLLEQRGFKVIMTKTDNSKSLGNIERAQIGNKAKADLVIRIHADSNNNTSAVGASMLVPQIVNENTRKIYNESKRCGQIVLNSLISEVGMKNRGLIFSTDMTGFNWSEVPVILVEMGFLSNPGEDKLLSSASYQGKLAKGLADGISAAFK